MEGNDGYPRGFNLCLRLTSYQKTKRESLYWFYDLPHNYQSTHLFGCVIPVYLCLLHFGTAVYISVFHSSKKEYNSTRIFGYIPTVNDLNYDLSNT